VNISTTGFLGVNSSQHAANQHIMTSHRQPSRSGSHLHHTRLALRAASRAKKGGVVEMVEMFSSSSRSSSREKNIFVCSQAGAARPPDM
jgi:hypothetical protein